jgi:DNA-binding MarR family transcriptional regulator
MAASPSAPPSAASPSAAQELDTSYLETLVGYNTRRATLAIVEVFMDRMAAYGLSIVDFSVLSLVGHNPGATSRQLCATLGILPPNLVGIIASLDKRGLIDRRPHPTDGRALGLHLTGDGLALLRQAEATAASLEDDATRNLAAAERATLIRLLQKIYR